ncbi:hypothetical protein Vafri_16166 [Volvox africanus]|nr:hypothetical protein Vafri_16166 [Volvox africanus]
MGKYAQLVIGPAGCGKSTYCNHLYEHCQAIKRTVHVVNLGCFRWGKLRVVVFSCCSSISLPPILLPSLSLDPAAEAFQYPVSLDIRDLVSLEDVMQELGLGPNGGLLYCMEYLEDNLHEWLGEELEGYGEDDYLVFDCPGQIELYNHLSVFRSFVEFLKYVEYCIVWSTPPAAATAAAGLHENLITPSSCSPPPPTHHHHHQYHHHHHHHHHHYHDYYISLGPPYLCPIS